MYESMCPTADAAARLHASLPGCYAGASASAWLRGLVLHGEKREKIIAVTASQSADAEAESKCSAYCSSKQCSARLRNEVLTCLKEEQRLVSSAQQLTSS